MLFVDCTTGATRIVTLAESTARALLGGNGLAARVLLDHVPAGIDAFDPANAVVFAVGPVTDTTVPGNSRACVAAKSPLTGLFFDSTFGGRFPATLKRTGFDAVVITGRAAAPSYVSVDESGAQVKPAADAVGQVDAGGGERADRGGGRRRGRHRHRSRRRAAGPLRGHGALLEEPRGRLGPRGNRRGARQQEHQGGGGPRRAQDRDRRSGRAQGAPRRDARAAAAPGRRRCRPSGRRSSSARSTRWARSAATTSRPRSSPRRARSAASR